MNEIALKTHASIAQIGAARWDGLVGPDGSPFLAHSFLRTLEETGCVDGRTGWHTALVTVEAQDGRLLGGLPLYVKLHSRGEFVYDWGWADAAARAGIAYYPKGVVAVPHTPVTGARLLVAPDVTDRDAVRRLLVLGGIEVARSLGLSGLHFNFIPASDLALFRELGLSIRTQLQYHWTNPRVGGDAAYSSFDDFLAEFRSKRRANIRRERRKLAEYGVTTRVVQGDDLTATQMRRMYRYYADTVNKYYWGQQYLNEDFFVAIAEQLREHVHLVVAELHGEQFAGAFNLHKADRLYGRYWGCQKEVEFAHFEVCMYAPIEWCIANAIRAFEPGHGGEHKHERGFEPTKTYSAHWLADERFAEAVAAFCAEEAAAVDQRLTALAAQSPLK